MTLSTSDTGTGTQPAADTAMPWRPFRMALARREQLSPSFVRLTFTGPDLADFGHDGPDQRVKLYIPRPGQGLPDLPMVDWYQHYRALDPATRGHIRTYTIRAVRPDIAEVDIDVVLHGHEAAGPAGPAAAWAANAQIGDELLAVGPNRAYPGDSCGHEWNPPVQVRDILIAGDETAVPAIAGILERLRAQDCQARIRTFLEIPEPGDALTLAAPGHAEITWLPRTGQSHAAGHGEPLVQAVCAAKFTDPRSSLDSASTVDTVDIDLEVLWEVAAGATSPVYAWVAGEAAAVKAIRRHLVRERGIDKGAVTFMGYWRLGRAIDDV